MSEAAESMAAAYCKRFSRSKASRPPKHYWISQKAWDDKIARMTSFGSSFFKMGDNKIESLEALEESITPFLKD